LLTHHLRAAVAVGSAVTLLHTFGLLGWLDALMLRLISGPRPLAHATSTPPPELPHVVLLGSSLYETTFAQTSPLRADVVATLVRTVGAARPATLVIDLDLSPGPAEPPQDPGRRALDDALDELARQGVRVVLPLPLRVSTPALVDRKFAWMRARCAKDGRAGVLFGLADVLTHQGVVTQYDATRPTIAAVAAAAGDALSLCRFATQPAERWKTALLSTAFDGRALLAAHAAPRLRPFNARLMAQADARIAVAAAPDRLPFDVAALAAGAVFVGGAYDARDRFAMALDESERRVEGVVVHALTYDSLQRPVGLLAGIGAFALDIALGVGLGFVFTASWGWHVRRQLWAAQTDTWQAQLAPRLSLFANLGLVALLVALTVFSAHAVLHPLNLWVNPGPIVLGVFAKFVLASRADAGGTAEHSTGEVAARLREWDEVLLWFLVAAAIASLLLPH
jgi:hypothetical protein